MRRCPSCGREIPRRRCEWCGHPLPKPGCSYVLVSVFVAFVVGMGRTWVDPSAWPGCASGFAGECWERVWSVKVTGALQCLPIALVLGLLLEFFFPRR